MEYFIQKESNITNVPLSQLRLKNDLIICSITRNEKLIVPGGRDEIKVGDNVLILTSGEIYNNIEDIALG